MNYKFQTLKEYKKEKFQRESDESLARWRKEEEQRKERERLETPEQKTIRLRSERFRKNKAHYDGLYGPLV